MRMRRTLFIVLQLGVLASRYLYSQCPDGSPPPCRIQPSRAATAPAPTSVAVLYFDNLSRDTADAYLADGLTEELIARLGQIERLVVKSRNAVRRYRGAAAGDPAALGRTLGVGHLVSGSVRRSASRLRVTVELVRAASGVRLWGDQYDREDADLLAIEEDIARAVATAVAGRLLPTERATVARRPTQVPAAYERFLRGNYYLAQRSPRGVARAIEEYEAAVNLDPGFTPALGRIAFSYGVFLGWGWPYPGLPSESLLTRGLAAAEGALQQNPNISDIWMARGLLLSFRNPRTFDGVSRALERAIALNPRSAEAYHTYGVLLGFLGKDSAEFASLQRALAIEPERPVTLLQLGMSSARDGRYQEARRWLDSALAVDPGFYNAYAMRALVRVHLGEVTRARRDAENAAQLGQSEYPLWGEAALAFVEVRMGDTLTARARVERLLRQVVDPDHPTTRDGWWLGMALVALGQQEQALDLLERVRPFGARLRDALRKPEFDPLRSHPRFERLVEESRPLAAPR